METPEFLAWAIGYTCPIRVFQDGSDPERTERQLRAVRAVSDALEEGRVLEGGCVREVNGFRIHDAIEMVGGLSAVKRLCLPCPANSKAAGVAGCFGMMPVLGGFHERVENFFDRVDHKDRVLFLRTKPRWYG